MKRELYTIETLSNLHVGAGDINFGVIDNQVQRNAITKIPNINSSSLKGALREHFTNGDEKPSLMVQYIFGSSNNDSKSSQAGAYSFFEAQMLTRPVRSSHKPYFSATSPAVIEGFLESIEDFGIEFDEKLKGELEMLSRLKPTSHTPLIFEDLQNVILEDDKAKYHKVTISDDLKGFLGKDIALFEDRDFVNLDLPVLARNALEDGISTNLWYEEVVPQRSKFFFFIGKPDAIDAKDYDQKIKGFDNRFESEGDIVQFGANRSIGYGFSKVRKVSL